LKSNPFRPSLLYSHPQKYLKHFGKVFEQFWKSILSQSKTSLEQDKLRNAVLLIQQETIRTNFVSSLIVLH